MRPCASALPARSAADTVAETREVKTEHPLALIEKRLHPAHHERIAGHVGDGGVEIAIEMHDSQHVDLLVGPFERTFDILQDADARHGPILGGESRRQPVKQLHGVEIGGQGGEIEL